MDVATPGIGDNQPNSIDALKSRVDDLIAVANKWAIERPEITDATMATKADDFIAQLTAELAAVEAERVKAKRPHLEAAAAVDTAYNPLKALLEAAKNLLIPRRRAWLQKEQDRLDQEKAAREREAQRLLDEAQQAAEQATKMEGDVVGAQVRAETAAREAEDAVKAVEAVPAKASVKGAYAARATGLRTTWKAEIANINAAIMKYREHPEMAELLTRLANAELRGVPIAQKPTYKIPGFRIFSTET